jgi:hypothetical protein
VKIRLVDVDGKIPNYALMKISTYHKRLGNDVAWYDPLFDNEDTDILYMSKVFTFTEDYEYLPTNAKIIKGGTGYDYTTKLPEEIESITELDYSLYPDCDYSIIFTTRGCVRKCPFCIVPKKEGLIHNVNVASLNPNGKYIMLLDNNFFANKTWRENIKALRAFKQPIDFNTGIDLRLLTEEQCEALGKLKIKAIHCAWDNYNDKDKILPKLEMLCRYVKPYKITVYVLVGFENKEIVQTDLERVMTLKAMGVNPFAMGYINFDDPNHEKTKSVIDFCRWCNNKFIFKKSTWEEYKPSVKEEYTQELDIFSATQRNKNTK